MKKNFFITVLLGAILISAGCTGPQNGGQTTSTSPAGNEGQANQGGASATAAGGGGETNPTTSAAPTTTAAATATTSGGGSDLLGDAKAELKGLFANRAPQYMAAYDTTSSMGGQGKSKSQMTYYVKGEGKIRIDMPDTGMGEMRTFLDSGNYIICTKQGQEWTCMKVPQQQTSQDLSQQTKDIQNNIDTSPVERLPDRVVAGTTAKCYHITFTVKDPAGTGGTTSWDDIYCISGEGVPLYMDGKSGSSEFVMEATSYSTSVSDSDFVPPATPQDMSNALKGIGGNLPTPSGTE